MIVSHYLRTILLRSAHLGLKYARLPIFTKVVAYGSASFALSFFGKATDHDLKDRELERDITVIEEADIYYNNYMIDNTYKVLRRFRSSNNPEVLWRLARVICEQGKLCKNPTEKARLFREALEFAEKALANSDASGCFGAHKWYAIILNYASESQGNQSQLKSAPEVKIHLERALELNPLDATTWMTLGMWHFSFANMGTVTRLAARALYGSPPNSTYEEALRYFERAEEISPLFCSSNNYHLGLIYDKLGRTQDAVKQYTLSWLSPVLTSDDYTVRTQVMGRLKAHGIDPNNLQDSPV